MRCQRLVHLRDHVTTTISRPNSVHKSLISSTSPYCNRTNIIPQKGEVPKIAFDYNAWWKENGLAIRSLLEGINTCDDQRRRPSKNISVDYQQVYSHDAVYQDLFIDAPPCRATLLQSFNLIQRFWNIEIKEWNSPLLVTSFSDDPSIQNQRHSERGNQSCEPSVCLRVNYTVRQMPRLPLFSSTAGETSPIFSSIMGENLFRVEYEGWIDLYLKPFYGPSEQSKTCSKASITATESDDCYHSPLTWKVYRHDDRLRVALPKFGRTDSKLLREIFWETEDALSIINSVPLVSTMFQKFRIAHGKTVQYFASKGV